MGLFDEIFENRHRRPFGHHDHDRDHHDDHDDHEHRGRDDRGHDRHHGSGNDGYPPPIDSTQAAVTICPSCRATLARSAGFRFCPDCGVRLGGSGCRACSAVFDPGVAFCPMCGAKQ